MKKFFALTALLVLLTSTSAFAEIDGSSHDFASWAGGEICAPCHTPHNAYNSTTAPLWAHTSATSANFTIYTSPTLNGAITQPAGISLACLSCHDGTTAMDSFIGTSTAGTTPMASGLVGNLGLDLTNDHPISIVYNTADTGLHGSITNTAVVLFDTKVECATCHDVHNGTSWPSMLVISNANSALCLACHNK